MPLYPPPPGPFQAGPAYAGPAYAGPAKRRLHPALGLVLVLALLGGGAYGGKLYLDRRSSSSSTAAAATPKTASQLAAYTIRPGDLASNWVAQPADDSDQSDGSSDDASSDSFTTCLGISAADASIQSAAESDAPDYDSATGDISSSATSFSTSTLTSRVVSDLTKAGAADCFKADLIAGTSTGAVTAANVTASMAGRQAGQPANVIATLQESFTATAASTGDAVPGFITAVFLSRGTVLSTVVFTGIGQPVDSATQASIVAKLSDRLG